MLQQLDLAQSALGEDLLAEDIGDLLDGHALVRLVVNRGAVVRAPIRSWLLASRAVDGIVAAGGFRKVADKRGVMIRP